MIELSCFDGCIMPLATREKNQNGAVYFVGATSGTRRVDSYTHYRYDLAPDLGGSRELSSGHVCARGRTRVHGVVIGIVLGNFRVFLNKNNPFKNNKMNIFILFLGDIRMDIESQLMPFHAFKAINLLYDLFSQYMSFR